MRSALVALLVVLAAAGVGATARDHRPAPFGDAVMVHRTGAAADAAPADPLGEALREGADGSVQLHQPGSGGTAWSYRRPGSVPVRLVPLAGGTTVAVWDDGMLTGIRLDGPEVGWHRFVPGLADWLVQSHATGTDPGPLLAPLDRGRAFLVATPHLVLAFGTADGAIRTDVLPPSGCSYDPSRTLALPDLVVLVRPCGRTATVEGFGAEGRRWQLTAGPLARAVPTGHGRIAVQDTAPFPSLRLDTRTGHALRTPTP